jgi:hypothetical protein
MGEFVAKNGTGGLFLGSGSPLTYTKIPGVSAFDFGAIQSEEIDATDFDSPAGWREFVNGLKSASEGSITLFHDPGDTTHEVLRSAEGGASQPFKALYDDRQVTFRALVKGFSVPQQVGGLNVATITIKLTGAPTWAVAS